MQSLPSSKCRLCPLFRRLHRFVPGQVSKGAEIVIVGEAPGEREVQARKPFVGPAGELLNSLLGAAKLSRRSDRLGITNVLKCQPKGNKLPEELDVAIECCSEILEREVKEAKVIVGLGNVPLRAFTMQDKITSRRGSVYSYEGRPFVATLHPSFLLRSSYVQAKEDTKRIPNEVVAADFVKAKRIAEGMEWWVEESYNFEPTNVELNEFLAELDKPDTWLSIDLETTKDRPHKVVPLTSSFTWFRFKEGATKLDAYSTVFVTFEDDVELLFMIDALRHSVPKGFHNGIFDVAVLHNVGFEVVNYCWDTMYIHHLLHAELSHKLAFVQSLYTTLPFHKDLRKEDDFERDWSK